jgi:hypothetical protein
MYKHITRYRYIRNPKEKGERVRKRRKRRKKKRGTAGSLACESKYANRASVDQVPCVCMAWRGRPAERARDAAERRKK